MHLKNLTDYKGFVNSPNNHIIIDHLILRNQGLSNHFDLHVQVLFKLTAAFYSRSVHLRQHVYSLIHQSFFSPPQQSPGAKQTPTWVPLQTLKQVFTVAYWRARHNKALQREWVKIKWPVLWKQPLKMTALFPMGRVMSPARAPPPARHLQETKRSEYFPTLPPSFLVWKFITGSWLLSLVKRALEIRLTRDCTTNSQHEALICFDGEMFG